MKKDFWKKELICLLLAVLLSGGISVLFLQGNRKPNILQVEKPKEEQPVIVIDAGHGGIDPGKVGVSGAYEKDINLSIAEYLKTLLEKEKITVFMTRQTDDGLYVENDSNKKRADMNARMKIMNQPEVDLIVSIHQNSFTDKRSRGAQVFYQSSSVEGEKLANEIQAALIHEVDSENRRQSKANNSYFILKKSIKPAVIVECGFLSNPEEEAKLLQEEYQKKIAEAVKNGILNYMKDEITGL